MPSEGSARKPWMIKPLVSRFINVCKRTPQVPLKGLNHINHTQHKKARDKIGFCMLTESCALPQRAFPLEPQHLELVLDVTSSFHQDMVMGRMPDRSYYSFLSEER